MTIALEVDLRRSDVLRVQLVQQDVVAMVLLGLGDLAVLVVHITEDDRVGRTRRLASRHHFAVANPAAVLLRLDPRDRPYFWIEEASDDWEPDGRSDHQAIMDGYASITPLQPDLTDHHALSVVETLMRRAIDQSVSD